MERRMTAVLVDPMQAHKWLAQAWTAIKPLVMAGHRLRVRIEPDTRSLEQNAKFHAICHDMARAGFEWAGKRRSAEQVKVLLISGHAIATKQGAEIIPGLEGEFVNIRESSAQMSVKRASSLIEYAQAFCAQHEIRLTEQE